ncbi:MAG: ABC transporter substrate-binding protein [Kiloniellales bacterium]
MRNRSKYGYIWVVVLTALALGIASGPVVAQSKGSMHVAFGDIPDPEMLNFLVAVARAKERGVEVKVSYLNSEDIAAQAVVSGQADIGVGTPYALIQKVKAPIRMFYQLAQMRFFPIVNTEKYKDWKDLDGEPITVHSRGSGTEAIMSWMASVHGIKYESVSYVPGSSVRAGAMLQGRIHVTVVDAERKRLLMEKGGGKFAVLALPKMEASDEALYANINWLKDQQEAVDILLEELIKVWREVNKDPGVIAELRDQYGLLPDLPRADVDDIKPAFAEGVAAGMYSDNGGGVASVKQDFSFFTGSGSLQGKAEDLKVEDFWYFEPLDRALDKLGRM